MKKKEVIVLSILVISLITVSLYQTLATDITMNKVDSSNADLSYTFDITDQTGRVVNVKAGATKILDVFVTNPNNGTIKYGIAYTPTTVKTDDITIAQLNTSKDAVSGLINKDERKQITLVIINNGTSDITLSLVSVTGYEHGGNLIVPDNHTIITDSYEIEEPTGANTIMEIFTSADKTVVINNDIEYQYAPSVSMMEDVGGNIRYYGPNPNNYVSFNNELWRIIGVFKDIDDGTGKKETRLKIIRSETLGPDYWDYNGENEWSTASLNNYLNGEYLNNLTLDSHNLIDDALWNLGGVGESDEYYSDEYYYSERETNVYQGHSTKWIGKVALMYPSDFMYAGDLSKCNEIGKNWEQENCGNMSWIFNNNYESTLTPVYNFHYSYVIIIKYGNVFHDNMVGVSEGANYRPVIFLKPTVNIIGGTGSKSDPYTLSMN